MNELAPLSTRFPDLARIIGEKTDPAEIGKVLEYAQAHMHLVTPSMVCGVLPPCTAIAISPVLVDIESETYKQGDGRALLKPALRRIGDAAGLTWPSADNGLIDEEGGRFWRYRACAIVRDFDGTQRDIVATSELDLRQDSPQSLAFIEQAIDSAFKPKNREAIEHSLGKLDDEALRREGVERGKRQIRAMQLSGLRRVETTTMNAVIRYMGLRQKYSRAELMKPFVVARIVFTGRSEDPEEAAWGREKIGEMFTASRSRLYGGRTESPVMETSRRRLAPAEQVALPPADDAADDEPRTVAAEVRPATAGQEQVRRSGLVGQEPLASGQETPAVPDGHTPAPNDAKCYALGDFQGMPNDATCRDADPGSPASWCPTCVAGATTDRASGPAESVAPATQPSRAASRPAPFGRDKGVPLGELDIQQLEWFDGALAANVADPEKARWKSKNAEDLAAVREVLAEKRQAAAPKSAEQRAAQAKAWFGD